MIDSYTATPDTPGRWRKFPKMLNWASGSINPVFGTRPASTARAAQIQDRRSYASLDRNLAELCDGKSVRYCLALQHETDLLSTTWQTEISKVYCSDFRFGPLI